MKHLEETIGSIYNGFLTLIERGPRVRCSRSGKYYYWIETVPDGKGGRVSKEYDYFVHDQSKTQSKHKQGNHWKMGARFRPSAMKHPQVDGEVTTAANYSVTATDRTITVNNSGEGNAITITLLLATAASNVRLTILRTNPPGELTGRDVYIVTQGSDKIVKLDDSETASYGLTDEGLATIDMQSDKIDKYYILEY